MGIGEKLKAWRLERYLSQEEAAREIGISHATISLLEGGSRSPQYKTWRKLAAAMGVTVAELQA